jgi:hypothetical protein
MCLFRSIHLNCPDYTIFAVRRGLDLVDYLCSAQTAVDWRMVALLLLADILRSGT